MAAALRAAPEEVYRYRPANRSANLRFHVLSMTEELRARDSISPAWSGRTRDRQCEHADPHSNVEVVSRPGSPLLDGDIFPPTEDDDGASSPRTPRLHAARHYLAHGAPCSWARTRRPLRYPCIEIDILG